MRLKKRFKHVCNLKHKNFDTFKILKNGKKNHYFKKKGSII